MAWYDDKKRMTYIATYKKDKEVREDVERAAQHGFVPQHQTGQSALQGGMIAGFGLATTTHTLTVTFVRDPRWLAVQRLDEALKPLGSPHAKLRSAEEEVVRRRTAFEASLQRALGTRVTTRGGIEKDLLKAAKRLVEGRDDAQKWRREFAAPFDAAVAALDHAVSVGAATRPFPYDRGLLARLRAEDDAATARRSAEAQFILVQQAVADAAEQSSDAELKRDACARKVGQAEAELATLGDLPAGDQDDPAVPSVVKPAPQAARLGFFRRASPPADPAEQARLDRARAEAAVPTARAEQEAAELQVARTHERLAVILEQRANSAQALSKVPG